jgi:Tat protein secretion system quality control protein TatD with DNase activity
VALVAERVAALHNLSVAEMNRQLTENTKALFTALAI